MHTFSDEAAIVIERVLSFTSNEQHMLPLIVGPSKVSLFMITINDMGRVGA